jgi:putative addiction module antidote
LPQAGFAFGFGPGLPGTSPLGAIGLDLSAPFGEAMSGSEMMVQTVGRPAFPLRRPSFRIIMFVIIADPAMLSLKITTIGSSAGLILSKEAMARLKVQKGDTLYLTEAPDGGYRLTPYDPDFERQMSLAEDIMHEDRDVLRALAK